MRVLVCPVNVSEGRRPDAVSRIAEAAVGRGPVLLDVHSDPDHNRSVLTLAGYPAALVDGLVAATRAAVEAIDLSGHEGVHPRLGAMDVVPFVPVNPDDMAAAITAARTCARRLWEEVGVPCFLYEAASPGPGVRSLPQVRREAFRSLAPDFGGPQAHPTAGATAVGAREILVAYNIELATDDAVVAKRIAAAVRERNGGLAHVRALGFVLASRKTAQVSLNLTRPAITPLADVFAAVSALAAAEGVAVTASEIVGLTPRVALPPSIAPLMLLRPPRILEDELAKLG
jgi:glutamate formiminotransferase